METPPHPDTPPAGFAPLENATEGERFNGPFYIARESGAARLGFRVGPRHLNAAGIVHGGVLALFADMLGFGLGVGSYSGAANTITLAIDFLAPAREGDWIEATPEITRETRSLIFFRAMITVEGAPIAHCNGIYKKRTAPREDLA
ncbi:MAG: PaaI family thioesterase [Roseicyclus sp.]